MSIIHIRCLLIIDAELSPGSVYVYSAFAYFPSRKSILLFLEYIDYGSENIYYIYIELLLEHSKYYKFYSIVLYVFIRKSNI